MAEKPLSRRTKSTRLERSIRAKINFNHKLTLADCEWALAHLQDFTRAEQLIIRRKCAGRVAKPVSVKAAKRLVFQGARTEGMSEEDIAAGRGRAESQARNFPFLMNPFSLTPLESGGMVIGK